MVKVEKGDVVRIRYTGRIKETGEIFDTTDEEIARQAGIYEENGVYGPVPVAVGAGHVLRGLDEALEGLEVGKKYEIEIPPEKGFGRRDRKLIKTFTLGQFRRQGIFPFPGMPVEIEIDGGRKLKGRVLTVSGGRVRVDFNHPYAGRYLVYEVEVVEKIDDPIEKVNAMIELRLPRVDASKVVIEVGEKDVVVDFTPVLDDVDKGTLALGEMLLESDLKFLGYEEITFKPSVEELLKPPEEAEAEEEVVEEKVEEEEKPEEAEPAETTEATEETTETAPEEKEEPAEEKIKETEEPKEEAEKAEEQEEKPKKTRKSAKGRKTRRTTTKTTASKKKTRAAEEKEGE